MKSSLTASSLTADFNAGLVLGRWYAVRPDVAGTTLSAYLDGSLILTSTDSSLAQGGVAVAVEETQAMFDDVSVRAR